MKKKVFIVGNGFDLNLGWRTKYKHFIKSHFCPIHPAGSGSCPMDEYLARKIEVERWYDLECILRDYAAYGHESHRKADPKDELFFNELRGSLSEYIKQESKKEIDTDSLAVRVLKAVLANGYFTSIYTFNYTDLYKIAEKAGIHSWFDFKFVHGNVNNNSIILGVDSNSELREGYAYLRKGYSEHYRTNYIHYDLQECDEVVFFGHSLGDMDYPYFRDFFYTQSHCVNRKDGKRITIFTKDNHSRIEILEQLRLMNEGQQERLQNDNAFNLVMTDAPDEDVLNEFFEHLRKDSVASRNAKMNNLANML
jgi:hypothetical protein